MEALFTSPGRFFGRNFSMTLDDESLEVLHAIEGRRNVFLPECAPDSLLK
jgi:hypothetical protein